MIIVGAAGVEVEGDATRVADTKGGSDGRAQRRDAASSRLS